VPRKRGTTGRRKVSAVPRNRANRRRPTSEAKPIDWSKYEKGQTGGSSQVPDECRPKSDTGSADDMWIRTMVLKPAIPEDIYVPPAHAPLQTEEAPQVDEGYWG
jgi:hypothetical protein